MSELYWPEVDDEVLKQAPPVMRAIVKALGFGRASEFLQQHGGLPFMLPKVKETKRGLMADEIQRLRITLLPFLNARNMVDLPKADKLLSHMRNQEIMSHKDKESITQQARKYNLTKRQVQNLRNEQEPQIFNRDAIRKNLTWNQKEIAAMRKLAYKAAATENDSVYRDILHKLDRATIRMQQNPMQGAQFDLF